MADILYTYKNQVYANITNRCNCSCTFCIRIHQDSVGDAETLWHKEDPSAEEIKAAMDTFDLPDMTSLYIAAMENQPAGWMFFLKQQSMPEKTTVSLSVSTPMVLAVWSTDGILSRILSELSTPYPSA